jgi:outer membrane protein OmpA-like peptidoglycan-associated protein
VATSAPVARPSVVGHAAAPVAVTRDRDVDLALPKPLTAAPAATSRDVSPPSTAADQWKVTLPMPTRAGDVSSDARAQGTTLLAAADRRAVTLEERPPAPSEPKVVSHSNGAGSPTAESVESRIVINFAFAGIKLTSEAKTAIREALPRVRSAERVVIAGRTDSVGDTSANQAIALARAISVKDYIAEVAPDIAGSIAIDARGNCCFVASNSTQDGRFKNRRVEIVMRGRVDA